MSKKNLSAYKKERENFMANDIYYIGANDEHGQNPPTAGKRTPIVPNLERQIYENEFNRGAKNKFIEACMRNNFSVFDVKPELNDISLSERVRRINSQNLTLLVTFAYNATANDSTFNDTSGFEVFYSQSNPKRTQSLSLANDIYEKLSQGTQQNGRGVKTLDIAVLSNVNCTSTLIEAGFMTNLREAGFMINPLFQTEVGEEACEGVCQFLQTNYIPRSNLSNYKTLRRGTSGNFVYLLQFLLNQNSFNLTVDGIYGSKTENAVILFQKRNNLTTDGIVGKNTWKTILTLPEYPITKNGQSGIYVKFLQQLLESKFFPVGNIDGVFGSQTEKAVKDFQSQNNLLVDGIVGNQTWDTLTKI